MKGVKIICDKTKMIDKAVRALTLNYVYVGIPSEKTSRKDGPITNAGIGYIQETGSPVNNIPQRPFLVPGVRNAQKDVVKMLKQGSKLALEGKPESVMKALRAAGLIAQNAVRRKITEGPFEPLKETTLSARRRRGRTGEKPLIDTGQLRNSITFVIREKP